jgi:hypothetical protein
MHGNEALNEAIELNYQVMRRVHSLPNELIFNRLCIFGGSNFHALMARKHPRSVMSVKKK